MNKIKFAIMADIHLDIMHDGKERLSAFLAAAKRANVDFLIHLGDFAYPNDTSNTICPIEAMPINIRLAYEQPTHLDKEALIREYNNFPKPTYHTLGNHDFDFLSPAEALKMYDIDSGYYSFRMGGWHFIVLDGNYYKDENGELYHYDRGNYFAKKDLPYISNEQLSWLEKELAASDEPVVTFSHQPMFKYPGGIKNADKFASIISNAKARGKKIRMCINGHLHVDDLDIIDGTLYYNMNSISNMWVGTGDTERARYSADIERDFPNLKYVIPFAKPIYAIITLDDEGIKVEGIEGDYVYPGPKEIGYKEKISPSVSSWEKKWE